MNKMTQKRGEKHEEASQSDECKIISHIIIYTHEDITIASSSASRGRIKVVSFCSIERVWIRRRQVLI